VRKTVIFLLKVGFTQGHILKITYFETLVALTLNYSFIWQVTSKCHWKQKIDQISRFPKISPHELIDNTVWPLEGVKFLSP